ncbi:bacterio-opsin activator domain-containing protein [Halobellus rubicundus]|uniref:Bacterio-opsin activator domain-containing protein n=1 Tax=Halobellus rubicundus TaxID=2996466 RepID=A0ABD5MA36_9EURY
MTSGGSADSERTGASAAAESDAREAPNTDGDVDTPEANPVVLVVDDDKDLADTCEYWLRDDFDVRLAYGGEEALEAVDEAVDVVLLDRRMPDLSGDEVLAEIDARGLDCRVAMMTAVEPDTDIVDMPFDEYLVKPVGEDDVVGTVEELLVRAEFDARVREYFALESTEAVLESRNLAELGDPDALDDLTARVQELRAERESEIRERERQLERARRINGFLRRIDQALVDATTRADIAETVCESFESAPYDGAWIARYDEAVDAVEPQATAASVVAPLADAQEASPDGGSATADPEGSFDPTRTVRAAIDDRKVVTAPVSEAHVERVLADPEPIEGQRRAVVVPVRYRDTVYGALVVYVRGAITDEERSMLGEVGETIGNGINAAESKQLLYGDTAVELVFEHTDTRDVVVDLSLEFGTTVRMEALTPSDDGVVSCYLSVEGVDAGSIMSAIAPLDAVADVRTISEESDETLVELRLTDASALVTVAELGATVESFTATDGVGELAVRVPPQSDLRALTAAVQKSFPETTVVAKREVESEVQSPSAFRKQLEEKLTDRQRDVMETALASGYFEWPRGSTAEEVADALGIAAPTFHEHLRAGERKLIESFFAETAGDRTASGDGATGSDD